MPWTGAPVSVGCLVAAVSKWVMTMGAYSWVCCPRVLQLG